jgi:large subunit ribosomal protein L18
MDKQVIKVQAMARKRRRVRGKVSGSAQRPRLSVFRSEQHIYGQLIDDDRGATLLSMSSISKGLRDRLKDQEPADVARVVGEALAERAIAAGINQVVFDRGGRRYIGRIQALADGARAKGLQF